MIRWVLSWFGIAVPPWLLPVAIAATLVLSCFTAYVWGRIDGKQRCAEAQLRAQVAELKRDRDAAIAAESTADAISKALAAALAKAEQEVKAYESELATRPESSACRLNSRDVERLR